MRIFRTIPLWVVIAFSALTLLIQSPWIVLPFYAGYAYQGINIMQFGTDEHYYLARANAVLQGRSLGHPLVAVDGELPDSVMSVVEKVFMMPLRALGLSSHIDVPMLYNILNTIGVFVLLVLIYLLVYAMSESALLAAAAAIFAIGGYHWLEYGTVIKMLLTGQQIFSPTYNIFGRSTQPYTALVPFVGFLICTYRALMQELPRPSLQNAWSFRYVLGAGVLFGSLFYNYFYAWTFALAFLGCVTLTSLVWRKWGSAVTAIAVGSVGIVLGAYPLYGLFQLYTSDMGRELSYFFLGTYGHIFIRSQSGVAVLILFGIYWYLHRNDKNNFFILALILAGWVALEQQLVTGRVIESDHYYWYFILPMSIALATYMGARLVGMYSQALARWMCIALIVGAFICTVGGQYRSFLLALPIHMREQDFAPVLKKLQELPEGVILGDAGGRGTSMLPNIYTQDTAFFNFFALVGVYPKDMYRDALYTYLYINKVSRSDAEAYLRKELASSTRPTTYTQMYEELEGYYTGIPLIDYRDSPSPHTDPRMLAARATFLPEIGKEYRAFAASPQHVREVLEMRGVRYILWDTRAYPEWDPAALGPLTVLATSTDVLLYSIEDVRN